MNAVVERYFSSFLDRVHDADGDINDTAGDGFIAIFQDDAAETHALRAGESALSLLAATDELNRDAGEHPLSIHIGIDSDLALVGSTRFEGSTRWTFTASGPVTNLAARLAGIAAAGQILTGPETARRLATRYRLERLGSERLKNFSEAVEIHRLLDRQSTARL